MLVALRYYTAVFCSGFESLDPVVSTEVSMTRLTSLFRFPSPCLFIVLVLGFLLREWLAVSGPEYVPTRPLISLL